MKRKLHKNVWILVAVLGIVWGHAAAIPAAVDSGMDITTPPVVTGRQLIQEKIDFLMATLQGRLEQLPETDRPALFVGEEFSKASGLDQLYEAILDPGHPLYDAVRKAGQLSQDAQARPALADDANLYLNLAILETLDELLTNPSLADEIRNTVFALIDLLKELDVPEAYQAPDTRFGFTTFNRSDPRDRIEREGGDDPVEINVLSEDSGFKYYGKEYDLDSDVTVYDDGFIVFGAVPANREVQFPSTASAYQATDGGFPWGGLNLETNMPAMLSPLVRHPDFGGVRVTGKGVEKTDLRYTYRWQAEYDWWPQYEITEPVATTKTVSPVQPEMPVLQTSASLYRNDWIVFNYEAQTANGGFPFMPMPGVAGLSPGDGSQGSGHPGEGLPRDWASGAGFVLAPLFESLPLNYDVDGNTYTAIYNGYTFDGLFGDSEINHDLPLVFSNTFYIFRPYEWGETGMAATPNKYMVSAGTRSILAGGLSSLDEAIGYVADDPGLLAEIDGGAFSPDSYIFGFQAEADPIGGMFIEGDRFIAYTVQVEEDIVNRKILEMHQASVEQGRVQSLMEDINTAKAFSQIRERDDWLTRKADAQAGRVLRDHKGNWVRVQQYVLRPDANTVQILSASLRDADGHSALSTLDFTTTLAGEGYGINRDLQDLPWNQWLNTIFEPVGGVTFKYIEANNGYPQLDKMSLTMKNPSDQQFQETRTFAGKAVPEINLPATERVSVRCVVPTKSKQYIINETLDVSGIGMFENNYYFNSGIPASANVTFSSTHGPGETGGFSYNFSNNSPSIDVSLYELSGNASKKSEKTYNDIWDALRVNSGGNAPDIGDNSLEIVVTDGAKAKRFNEFDVVYIPMSRMLWKDKPNSST